MPAAYTGIIEMTKHRFYRDPFIFLYEQSPRYLTQHNETLSGIITWGGNHYQANTDTVRSALKDPRQRKNSS